MKTTYQELTDLFKLRSDRQVRIALNNRIRIIDGQVYTDDEQLSHYLEEFRKKGVMLQDEVCSKYNISHYQLRMLINKRILSYFQLTSERGSRYVFLRSEIEKEHDLVLEHLHSNIQRMYFFLMRLMDSCAPSLDLGKKELAMLQLFYIKNRTYEEIAGIYKVSAERVRQLIRKSERRMILRLKSVRDYRYYHDRYERLNFEHQSLLKRHEKLCKEEELKKQAADSGAFVSMILREMDFSVRALNIFAGADIGTVADLLRIGRSGLSRCRNSGKKTIAEVEEALMMMGINWDVYHEMMNENEPEGAGCELIP